MTWVPGHSATRQWASWPFSQISEFCAFN